jgi:hypothetical protein
VVNKSKYVYEHSYIRTHNISFRVMIVMVITAATKFLKFEVFAAVAMKILVT